MSIGYVEEYWDGVWQRHVDIASIAERWDEADLDVADMDRLYVTEDDLAQAARRMACSVAGPDGWTGEELLSFPHGAWGLFAILVFRWKQAGVYPDIWKHMGQVMIPKDTTEEDAPLQWIRKAAMARASYDSPSSG